MYINTLYRYAEVFGTIGEVLPGVHYIDQSIPYSYSGEKMRYHTAPGIIDW